MNKVVQQEINALAHDVQVKLTKQFGDIEAHGILAMRGPHIKHLEGRLWEIRVSGRDTIARAIYVTVTGQIAVVVHAFTKKTEKTAARNLELARARAKEVK